MPQVRKLNVNGEERDAVELSFDTVKEPWSEYTLADGGRVRIKVVVRRIYRVLNAAGQPDVNPEGDPFVVVESQNTVVATND